MSAEKPRRRTANRTQWVIGIAAMAAVAVAVGVSLPGEQPAVRQPISTAGAHDSHGNQTVPSGYRLTGESSPMGGRIIEPPATRSGTATAGGVEVTDGADVVLGHVPLAFAVKPTWRLRNTTDQEVTLGPPKVAVLKGCCPSDAVLGTTTLAPGAETTLSYTSQMHPGMDGEHLFRLSVPVRGAAEVLSVTVAAHFS